MNLLKPALGGLVGGIVGAAIWAGIVYATGYSVGWVAWGLGALVGLGVRIMAGQDDGWALGFLAAGIAFVSLLGGKYLAVTLVVNKAVGEIHFSTTPDEMLVSTADDVVKERLVQGKKVNFAPGMTLEKASKRADYPADVWKEAEKRWFAIPAGEQARLIKERDQIFEAEMGKKTGELRDRIFQKSFSPFDLLWFGLAMFTAFKLGSGMASSDD